MCAHRAAHDGLVYDRAVTSQPVSPSIDREALQQEVGRVIEAAAQIGAPVRVLGSIGVAIHCPESAALLPKFERTYLDIDVAAYRRDAKAIAGVLAGLGYQDDREVYIASEGARSIFDDPGRRLHLDVFYDRLDFCHVIPLVERLEIDQPTIPLAELLLSKLQIVKINDKDVVDAILLLLDHPLGTTDVATINLDRIAALSGADWGLWRTLAQNLDKITALARSYPQLTPGQRDHIDAATTTLKDRMDAEPKSMAWRMRSRVGDRRQWWTDVEEVR